MKGINITPVDQLVTMPMVDSDVLTAQRRTMNIQYMVFWGDVD